MKPVLALFPAPPPAPDPRVDAVLRGTDGAWEALSWNLHAEVVEICRRRSWTAPAAEPADHHHDVALAALERIAADDFRALRRFAEVASQYKESSLSAWLAAVAASVHVDLCRSAGVRRRVAGGRRTEAVATEELGDQPAEGDDVVRRLDLVRAAEHVESPSFPPEQRAALAMWLRGEEPEAIAAALGLAHAAAATRLLHAARERLRRWAHRRVAP